MDLEEDSLEANVTIQEFLIWLSGGLGSSLVISYFAERIERFRKLDLDIKKLYKTIWASALAVISYVVYTYVPVDFWTLISPYWQVVLGVILVNYGVEIFHLFDKKVAKETTSL